MYVDISILPPRQHHSPPCNDQRNVFAANNKVKANPGVRALPPRMFDCVCLAYCRQMIANSELTQLRSAKKLNSPPDATTAAERRTKNSRFMYICGSYRHLEKMAELEEGRGRWPWLFPPNCDSGLVVGSKSLVKGTHMSGDPSEGPSSTSFSFELGFGFPDLWRGGWCPSQQRVAW